jgi:hypothetical protein
MQMVTTLLVNLSTVSHSKAAAEEDAAKHVVVVVVAEEANAVETLVL